jgi:hypothetical protein
MRRNGLHRRDHGGGERRPASLGLPAKPMSADNQNDASRHQSQPLHLSLSLFFPLCYPFPPSPPPQATETCRPNQLTSLPPPRPLTMSPARDPSPRRPRRPPPSGVRRGCGYPGVNPRCPLSLIALQTYTSMSPAGFRTLRSRRLSTSCTGHTKTVRGDGRIRCRTRRPLRLGHGITCESLGSQLY